MAVNFESENTVLRLWLQLRRVGETLALCQDSIYRKYGLTSEQFAVLAALKSRGPLRPSDLASLLERRPNSMSTQVDRMVKAGLVVRRRDTKDRRVVRVFMTINGETRIGPAIVAGWEHINKVLSTVSENDRRSLASILEKVKCELLACENPEMDKPEILQKSITNQPGLYERMLKNLLPSGYEPKRKYNK
jgi:DNA-binding MarR family transcriptional regulator